MVDNTITQTYLSLIRTFKYYPQDASLNQKFTFLRQNDEYYPKAIEDIEYLGTNQDLNLKIGKIRNILDTNSSSIKSTPLKSDSDPFFYHMHEYYHQLFEKKMLLTPHYPCVVDVLPSEDKEYTVNFPDLPGSLKNAKGAKLSLSIRLYPAGLASLKLGIFLVTDKSFDSKSIMEFLTDKTASISITDKKSGLITEKIDLNSLTRFYANTLLEELHSKKKLFCWDYTYSSVDIIESSQFTFENDFDSFFSPIINLGKKPRDDNIKINNLSHSGDVLLFGPESAVSYFLPSNDARPIRPDRRKIRRWVRNSIELFLAQRLIANFVTTTGVSSIYNQLQSENWIKTLNQGDLPPTINQLFSYWNYLNLHLQDYPLEKQDWRDRYQETIKVVDSKNQIQKANEQAMKQLQMIQKDASNAKKEAGDGLKKFAALLPQAIFVPKDVKPLTILFLAADPFNQTQMDLNKELNAIKDAVDHSTYKPLIKIESRLAIRSDEIIKYLLEYNPNIVHISTHGTTTGEIKLHDETGALKPVDATAIANLFAGLENQVQCVILNACHSENLAEQISKHINCAIGMSAAIGDEAAINFAKGFYCSLGEDQYLDECYAWGCKQIGIGAGIDEVSTPRIKWKNDIPQKILLINTNQ